MKRQRLVRLFQVTTVIFGLGTVLAIFSVPVIPMREFVAAMIAICAGGVLAVGILSIEEYDDDFAEALALSIFWATVIGGLVALKPLPYIDSDAVLATINTIGFVVAGLHYHALTHSP